MLGQKDQVKLTAKIQHILSCVRHSSHATCVVGHIFGLCLPVTCPCSKMLLPRYGGNSKNEKW